MSQLGICGSGGIYADTYWRNMAGEPDFPSIIRKGNLRHIRLIGAGQANDALNRACAVRTNTVVHWRHMLHVPPGGDHKTDDGMWRLPPEEWRKNVYMPQHDGLPLPYNRVRVPYQPHVSTNNEFSTKSLAVLNEYCNFEIERARDAKMYDMRLDMLSFPSHWPCYDGNETSEVRTWLDKGYFDDLFRAIGQAQGPTQHPRIWCLPNAYINRENLDALRNILKLYKRFEEVNGFPPHMAVGEYGYARMKDGQFDPHGGHLADPTITAEQSIDLLVNNYNIYLRPKGIGAMLYTAGLLGGNEVKTFHYAMKELDYFAQQAAKVDTGPLPTPILPIPEPPVIVEPPPDTEDTKEIPTGTISPTEDDIRRIVREVIEETVKPIVHAEVAWALGEQLELLRALHDRSAQYMQSIPGVFDDAEQKYVKNGGTNQ